MATNLFAFAGLRRAGKGTAAGLLRRRRDGYEFNFADEVKRQAQRFVAETTGEFIDPWNDKSDRIRGLLQTLGTEVGRAWQDDLWVKFLSEDLQAFFRDGVRYGPATRQLLARGIPKERRLAYVTDLRFPNEAAEIRRLGGVVIWVHCDEEVRLQRLLALDGPQTASRALHVSEHSFGPDDADFTLYSDNEQALTISLNAFEQWLRFFRAA